MILEYPSNSDNLVVPGEGNGNPLQCSCLENPRDRGAWWAAIYGAAQSRTQLKHLSSSSLFPHQAATVASMVCLLAAIYSELSLQELLVQAGKIPIQ